MSWLDRQSFLGPDSDQVLQDLTVGLVGLGGGNSHVVQQLANLGAGGFVLVDDDVISETNLNRLVGGTLEDVLEARPKTEIAKRMVLSVNPEARIACHQAKWQEVAEHLRACDIIIGGGDIAGEEQTGHLKVLGMGFYQKLLERAVAALRRDDGEEVPRAVVNLGAAGLIPEDYVSDPAIRLNFYARLLRTVSLKDVDDLEEEFEDRFGELPEELAILLRLTKLQIAAGRLGIVKLDAGPKALAVALNPKVPAKTVKDLSARDGAVRRDDRIVFEQPTDTALERIRFFENLLDMH